MSTFIDSSKQLNDMRLLRENVEFLLEKVKEFVQTKGVIDSITEKEVKINNKKTVGRSQFRSLVDVTEEAACLAEVIAFLQYKVGKGNGEEWATRVDNRTSLGERLIEIIEQISDRVESILKNDEKFKLAMLNRFFGYLYWEITYQLSKKVQERRN